MARGPFSLSLHRNLILALGASGFPTRPRTSPTTGSGSIARSRPAGGDGFRHRHPGRRRRSGAGRARDTRSRTHVIRALIGKCSGLVVLVDTQGVGEGQGQELFAMQLISYLDSLHLTRRRPQGRRSPWPWSSPRPTSARVRVDNPEAFARATPRRSGGSASPGSRTTGSIARPSRARPASSSIATAARPGPAPDRAARDHRAVRLAPVADPLILHGRAGSSDLACRFAQLTEDCSMLADQAIFTPSFVAGSRDITWWRGRRE